MKVIGQPNLEKQINQIKEEIQSHPQIGCILYPEGYLNDNLDEAIMLART